MDDLYVGALIGTLLTGVVLATGSEALVIPARLDPLEAEIEALRTEVCTLAFTHATSPADSLEVLRTYDYCEIEPTEHP